MPTPTAVQRYEEQGARERPRTCTEPFVMAEVSLLKDRRISDAAFRLFAVLKSYARHKDYCWPSHQTLASDMGLQPRRVADLLKQLVTVGLVEIESRAKAGLSNIYRLLTRTSRNAAPATTPKAPAQKSRGGMQSFAGGGTQFSADEVHEEEVNKERDHTQRRDAEKIVCVMQQPHDPHQPDTESSTISIHSDPMRQALATIGVAPQTAGVLARQLVARGRDVAYIERWQTIATGKDNPAGYMVTMLRANAEPPTTSRSPLKPIQGIPAWAYNDDERADDAQDTLSITPSVLESSETLVEGAGSPQSVPANTAVPSVAVAASTTMTEAIPPLATPPSDSALAPASNDAPGDDMLCRLLNSRLQEEYRTTPKWERPRVRYARQDGDLLLMRFTGSPRPSADVLLHQVQRLRPQVVRIQEIHP